jgi:choline dehydrogenase-like flavoprotein
MRLVKSLLLSFLVLSSIGNSLEARSRSKRADYVIVGVGTAGAVLAKKLSDDRTNSVIGIHEGPNLNDDPLIKFSENAELTVPAALIQAFPDVFESGNMVPQVFADNQTPLWVVAKPLGGASSINAGAYVKGSVQGYSKWEAIAGPSWSPARIFDVFKALETYDGETTNPASRGYHGPVNVRQEPNPSPLSQKVTGAIVASTGVPFVLDYNDPNTPIGASSQFQYTQKGPDGELRVSSATAFLNRKVMTPSGSGVNGRKLNVLFNSKALRTLWEGNKAVGVEYLSENGNTKRVYAKKGVIVTAGLKSSPFLMLSGVGPKAVLNALNIPVVFDNPNVGQSLADQPHILLLYTANPDDYALNSAGIFSNTAMFPRPGGDPKVRSLRFSGVNPFPGILLVSFDLLQPKSRGSVSINSADPLAPPVVDDGLLSNSDDLALFKSAFQTYIANISTTLSAMDPDYQLVFPDPDIISNDVLLTDFIKEEIDATEHFQCHCRMAPQNQGGVVDSNGRVYGVQNLFVADNSANPEDMDGSPMQTGYLVAYNIALLLQGK